MDLKCSYCDEVTSCDCPDEKNHYPEAQFICETCQTLCEMGESEENLKNSPRREEVKKLIEIDQQAGELAGEMAENTFSGMWSEDKETYKSLSKKEIAETFYFKGLHFAATTFLGAASKRVEDVENAIEDYKKGKISAGKAAEMAGVTIQEMNEELSRRGIALRYVEK